LIMKGMLEDGTAMMYFNNKQFELDKNDKSTWKEAIEHGKKQGIPEKELDFQTQ